MAVTTLLGLPIPSMSETVGKTIPDLASAMQMIDQKLGGVRIVDHNLDVTNPENGYYVRWENGLQVCWRIRESVTGITTQSDNVAGITWHFVDLTWTFPASFSQPPAVSYFTDIGGLNFELTAIRLLTTSSCAVRSISLNSFTSFYFDAAMAIGRWK